MTRQTCQKQTVFAKKKYKSNKMNQKNMNIKKKEEKRKNNEVSVHHMNCVAHSGERRKMHEQVIAVGRHHL